MATEDILRQNELATTSSAGYETAVNSAGNNVVQGNTIGGNRALSRTLYISGQFDTIGGSRPGQGNVFSDGNVSIDGKDDVVQGNRFTDVDLYVGWPA
jgi:hypothetical protein